MASIQNHNFNNRCILGIGNVCMPVLRHLAHTSFVQQADLQNVVVCEVNTVFHRCNWVDVAGK